MRKWNGNVVSLCVWVCAGVRQRKTWIGTQVKIKKKWQSLYFQRKLVNSVRQRDQLYITWRENADPSLLCYTKRLHPSHSLEQRCIHSRCENPWLSAPFCQRWLTKALKRNHCSLHWTSHNSLVYFRKKKKKKQRSYLTLYTCVEVFICALVAMHTPGCGWDWEGEKEQ